MCALSESGGMGCPRHETRIVHAYQSHQPWQIDMVAHVPLFPPSPRLQTPCGSATQRGPTPLKESMPSSVATVIILIWPHRARRHARPHTIRLILSRASALVRDQTRLPGSTAVLTVG